MDALLAERWYRSGASRRKSGLDCRDNPINILVILTNDERAIRGS